MRIFKVLLSAVSILFIIFLVGGFFIPEQWTVSRSMTIHASADQIYPYVSNFKEWPKWAPWNNSKDKTLQYTYEGADAGIGAKQSWTSEQMGTGWMHITSANPQTGIAYDLFIDMGRSQSTLQGNIAFAPNGQETKIIWTDQGNSGHSYVKRWMSLLLSPMLAKDMTQGLTDLKTLVEKNNTAATDA